MELEKRKRGRPKKPETLEAERIATMFKNPPEYLNDVDYQRLEFDSEHNKRIQEELIADYSPTIPDNLIYALASIGTPEFYESYESYEDAIEIENKIINKYNTLVDAEKNGRITGAEVTSKKSVARAKAVWAKNQDLINKIGPNYSMHRVTTKIYDEWTARGDGGNKPHINTIKNWIKQIN